MKKADKFNPGKWLVENKITFQSRLNEEEDNDPLKIQPFEKGDVLLDKPKKIQLINRDGSKEEVTVIGAYRLRKYEGKDIADYYWDDKGIIYDRWNTAKFPPDTYYRSDTLTRRELYDVTQRLNARYQEKEKSNKKTKAWSSDEEYDILVDNYFDDFYNKIIDMAIKKGIITDKDTENTDVTDALIGTFDKYITEKGVLDSDYNKALKTFSKFLQS